MAPSVNGPLAIIAPLIVFVITITIYRSRYLGASCPSTPRNLG
ncbi:hypothetical protein AZE42_11359 [Rhizopogon vesiculosus]|uniref:Uncharacterized protein n=1 Tax=Rhizopogon vesiculosus TaxID=180088 RepID=A0A1J8QTD6_9AGAM|nr:hypothetical protein AZE42_11359 [Rhizopogon vesiculosus]